MFKLLIKVCTSNLKSTDGLKIWLYKVNGGRVVCLFINRSTVQETTINDLPDSTGKFSKLYISLFYMIVLLWVWSEYCNFYHQLLPLRWNWYKLPHASVHHTHTDENTEKNNIHVVTSSELALTQKKNSFLCTPNSLKRSIGKKPNSLELLPLTDTSHIIYVGTNIY